jgi:hypothetical protein
MRMLASWPIVHGRETRYIELLHGDLSNIPVEHAVDLLIVSAFKNDYSPTPSSLIGALARRGLSVASLADHKIVDLRDQFACWWAPVREDQFAFQNLMCIESGWRGSPPELTDDLFRALAPYLLTTFPNASVAMPLIGTGDQGWPASLMIASILTAACKWIRRGLPLARLKIVVYSDAAARVAQDAFVAFQRDGCDQLPDVLLTRRRPDGEARDLPALRSSNAEVDVFLSYSHQDREAATAIFNCLQKANPGWRIFFDSESLRAGQSWLLKIAESLDSASKVIALYTPDYWSSKYCKDEFIAALTRQHDTSKDILVPVFFRDVAIPYLFRNLQHIDCREADMGKLSVLTSLLDSRSIDA